MGFLHHINIMFRSRSRANRLELWETRAFAVNLPVIVGRHGGDRLRDGLVHVIETGRLDGRQPVVVPATASAGNPAAYTSRVRRCAGRRADGRGRGRQRGRRAVLLVESSSTTSTASAAAPALVSQFLLASPFRSPVAEPNLR